MNLFDVKIGTSTIWEGTESNISFQMTNVQNKKSFFFSAQKTIAKLTNSYGQTVNKLCDINFCAYKILKSVKTF